MGGGLGIGSHTPTQIIECGQELNDLGKAEHCEDTIGHLHRRERREDEPHQT